MPGSMYMRSLRLSRAYSEGFAGVPAANPHPAGSPAAAAYDAGALQNCATYAGVAGCSGVAVLAQPIGQPIPQAGSQPIPQEAKPTSANTKAEITDYLLRAGWHQQELDGKTKAELLELVAAPPPPLDF